MSTQCSLTITGGHGGLARAIATRFNTPEWLTHTPGREELDVTATSSITSYFSRQPTPDILVCNAGVIRDAPLATLNPADWQHVIDVNYHGAHLCAAAVLPAMCRRGSGHIIFISSRSAVHPPGGQAAYATAKAALLGLTRDLAISAGTHGIRINTILPGFLETNMTRRIPSQRRTEILHQHALGRFNTPCEVANFIWHLHQHLPHTSGQIFQLDSRPA